MAIVRPDQTSGGGGGGTSAPATDTTFQTALGVKSWNYNPAAVESNGGLISSVPIFLATPTQAGVTYNGVTLCANNTVTGSPTNFAVCLATYGIVGATGSVLAQSNNLAATIAGTGKGLLQFPFNAPYVETVSGLRMVGILQVGTFTTGSYLIYKSDLQSQWSAGNVNLVSTVGGSPTAFPANGSPLGSTYAQSANSFWVGLY